MPSTAPDRITPLQVLALLVIWTAAILSLLKPAGTDARSLAVKTAPAVSCAKAFREG